MRVWLSIAALLLLGGSLTLWLAPEILVSSELAQSHATLVHLVAALEMLFASSAAWSARKPDERRPGIYSTIFVLLVKWILDLYGVLVALPPKQAALSLADLILSVALLVGILEALPRTLGGTKQG